ncbi:aldehyde dehydrogenase family protein [Pseudomonas typographi]|uniref:Aldehyde dehydrogenase family protein n=1 Tax=Pseudomonas typographi TaxID=2715964 RepID=A0ABR7Z5G6_9PSED|nr:aldehyde dehydrogenase family protein [Pseudomonas typographi]MBD1600603.1 aldehyde dehydrogenase family protein [Pseudomonas typographi]
MIDLTRVAPLLNEGARQFLGSAQPMLIGEQWCNADSGELIDVFDPATGTLLSQVPAGGASDVDRAVTAARQALAGPWGQMTGLERGKLITRFAQRLEALADELAQIEAIDCGKAVTHARYVDVPLTANTYHYMAGWASKVAGATVGLSSPGNAHAFTLREPIGVVAQIVPWNFPLVLTAYKLAPILATGCTTIIKPAEQTPLSTLRLAQIALEVGFPPGVINVVTGYGAAAGAALAAHPGVDKIAFTGSTEVGKQVARTALDSVKRVTLELGGKSPMVVFADADLDHAIPALAQAIFFHQGQVCTAGSRLLVHRSIHDRVIEGIIRQAGLLKMGHGLEPETTLGPLISKRQLDRVRHYIEQGQRDGADVISTGLETAESGYFVQPTLLVGASPESAVMREEIFGPVLCVTSFGDEGLHDIARQANDTPFGLSASVWTHDLSTAHTMAKLIKAGSVWVNAHHCFDPALPFGGFKQSGFGREQGAEAIHTFTEVKSVCMKL